ncbi:MAG: hypothetical protein ABWY45_10955 [Mycobacterium sp.]
MTPTTVRMVLVEGEKADGRTVDHDVFDIPAEDPSATAPDQVVAAILGTRESATEGGHRLVGTGVTWRDHGEAAALRDALTARGLDDVMLVSELHAAGALAQAVGRAVGYDRTALMFLERNTATLSVVDTADGSIVKVQSHDLHTPDAVAELAGMVAGLESLESPPQGVFVVGSGIAVGAIKLQLESATSLPVSAPDEPELALARGAALASAHAPLFEASTVGLASARDGVDGTTAGAALAGLAAADVTQAAGINYTGSPAALAYSEADPESQAFPAYEAAPAPKPSPAEQQPGRKPFLLVGSALTSIFVLGVTALVISLAVSIRPSADQRPSPAESAIIPSQVSEAAVPPAPAPALETIQAPVPVVQEAPQPQAPARTVFVERPAPAPAAPAPAPAAPAPAPAPAAPAPIPAPVAPPVVAPVVVPPPIVIPPPVIQLPAPQWPSIFRPPWNPPKNNWPGNDDDEPDWTPPWRPTTQPSKPTQTQTPKPTQTQQPEPTKTQAPEPTKTQQPQPTQVTVQPQVPSVPQVPQQPQVPQVPQVPQIQLPQLPQWPGSGSSGGSEGSGRSSAGSDSGSGGSGGSGRGGGSGDSGSSGSPGESLIPIWPFG